MRQLAYLVIFVMAIQLSAEAKTYYRYETEFMADSGTKYDRWCEENSPDPITAVSVMKFSYNRKGKFSNWGFRKWFNRAYKNEMYLGYSKKRGWQFDVPNMLAPANVFHNRRKREVTLLVCDNE